MTYEKSRSSWDNGFRGYKDNSPEAKHRRLQQEADRILSQLMKRGEAAFNFGRMELLTYGRVTHYIKGDTLFINGKPFQIL